MSSPDVPRKKHEQKERHHFSSEAKLKMGLFANGLVVSDEARQVMQGPEGRSLTTGDYVTTGGLILRAGDLYTINAPLITGRPFPGRTPHVLESDGKKLWIVSSDGGEMKVTHIPPPAYMDKMNASDRRYGSLAATHPDRARISPIPEGCALDCKFCDMAASLKGYPNPEHRPTAEEMVDSVGEAIEDPDRPAQHLLISGGTPIPRDFVHLQNVYRRVAEAYPGLDIDIMMTPSRHEGQDLLNLQELKKLGTKGLSINLELFNDDIAREVMRGKFRIGKTHYLRFLKQAVEVFGVGNVRSMLIVGIEPIEET